MTFCRIILNMLTLSASFMHLVVKVFVKLAMTFLTKPHC